MVSSIIFKSRSSPSIRYSRHSRQSISNLRFLTIPWRDTKKMDKNDYETVTADGKTEPEKEMVKDGSICGFDNLHSLLQASLGPQNFQVNF